MICLLLFCGQLLSPSLPDYMMSLPSSADIVIIGGGIIGVSIAYHLSQMHAGRVLLLERKHLGAGATGMSSGLVRMHYDNPIEVAFAYHSFELFQHFSEIVGAENGFVRTGFVRIDRAQNLERMKVNVATMQAMGVTTEMIDRDALQEIAPYMDTEDVIMGAYEPLSGYADPHQTVMGLADAARRGGVAIQQGVEVVGILQEHDRISGVRTTRGDVATPVVINAAGAWGGVVAGMAGVEAEVVPAVHQASIVETPSSIPFPHLTFIDRIHGVYARPETGGLTLAGRSGEESDSIISVEELDTFSHTPRQDIEFEVLERLCNRIPLMATGAVRKGHVGAEGYTRDGHALLGPAPHLEGFYLAIGMSGHGFKEGPAIGRVMAEMVLEGRSWLVDVEPLRVNRFAEEEPYHGEYEYL